MQRHLVASEQVLNRYWGMAARLVDRSVLRSVGDAANRVARRPAHRANRATRRALRLGALLAVAEIDWDSYGLDFPTAANNIFDGFLGFILGGFEWVLDAAKWAANQVIGWVRGLFDTITSTLHPLFDSIFGSLADAVGKVLDVVQSVIDLGIKVTGQIVHAVADVLGQIGDIVWGMVSDLWNFFEPLVQWVVEHAIALARSLIDIALDVLQGLIQGVIDVIENLIWPAINEILEQLRHFGEFGFELFWDLFWDTFKIALGIAESPLAIIKGAWWLLRTAADFAGDTFQALINGLTTGDLARLFGDTKNENEARQDDLARLLQSALGL